MTTQFRDTQFGHLVRLVSDNKLFPYPDEIDPSLWKKSVQRCATSSSPRSGDQHGGSEKLRNTNNSTDASVKDLDPRNDDLNRAVERGKDVYLVDWYGPDDPENPQNWSSGWKLLISFQICFFNFAVYMASSIYVPGESSIMDDFGVSETVATLGLSLFTA
ncbi:uncharacterized protein Z518_09213 [Rhinocladiella mackenziei CBS 650.93]|uniref:Major facilitator superfamily (MFS) profile domain-containing protein n=1 Tax=Rhinocladiella mackenziei CBS 650.93 TaxID=1442369 RepID=A0A0D2FHP4_9EURO|nr:uncharacterized protein Z518_09213 [Rhinocladiella mackenziei CBS 650.93]KIX01487.1 hypothetical protein Z518_09213 [Rhinocladiella mackenziei CBS 650.93]